MKNSIVLILAYSSFAYSAEIDWKTYMVQVPLTGGQGIPKLVNAQGSSPSLPIGEKGSRFELWGLQYINNAFVSEHLIDTTETGTYKPDVLAMNITTGDPWPSFARTRVDQPFTVNIDVEGLLPRGVDVPIASQMLLVEHHVDLYPYGSYDGSQVESTRLVNSFTIESNGLSSYPFQNTNLLDPSNPSETYKRAGRERFIVYALADGAAPQRILKEQQVVILPYSSGELLDIDPDIDHIEIPSFTASLERLYPSGDTWVEFYEGPYSPSKRGTRLHNGGINTAGWSFTSHSANLSYEKDHINTELIKDMDGIHTFVLRTSSPFPGESFAEGGIPLGNISANFVTLILVNGMLTTSE